jgi:hypothetical protein
MHTTRNSRQEKANPSKGGDAKSRVYPATGCKTAGLPKLRNQPLGRSGAERQFCLEVRKEFFVEQMIWNSINWNSVSRTDKGSDRNK